jgi:hypothetical protein
LKILLNMLFQDRDVQSRLLDAIRDPPEVLGLGMEGVMPVGISKIVSGQYICRHVIHTW